MYTHLGLGCIPTECMYFYLPNSDVPFSARFDFERQFPELGPFQTRSSRRTE